MSHSIDCLLILAFLLQADSLHLGKHAHSKHEDRILDESNCITCRSDDKEKYETQEGPDNRMRVQGSNEADKFKQLTRTKRGSIYRDEDAEHDSAEEAENEKEEKEGITGENASEDLKNKPGDKTEDSNEDGKASQAVDDNETDKDHTAEESDGPEKEKNEEEEKDGEEKDGEMEGKGGEDKDKSVGNTTQNGSGAKGKIDKDTDKSVENEKNIGDKDQAGDAGDESNTEGPMNPELEIQLQLDMVLTPEDIWNLISGASDIIYNAGDYLISLVLKNLKHNLHHTRMNERFKTALRRLTDSKDADGKKALNLLTAKIRQQFGRSYEIQLVKFLKNLRDGTEF